MLFPHIYRHPFFVESANALHPILRRNHPIIGFDLEYVAFAVVGLLQLVSTRKIDPSQKQFVGRSGAERTADAARIRHLARGDLSAIECPNWVLAV